MTSELTDNVHLFWLLLLALILFSLRFHSHSILC